MAQRCHRPTCIVFVIDQFQLCNMKQKPKSLKIVARIHNDKWKGDENLKTKLEQYVRGNLKREEILNFMKRDYGDYAWSLQTLDRRLNYFEIRRSDTYVTVEQVKEAVEKEIDGPGKLLGYQAMNNKIRQNYHMNIPRNLVHAVMFDVEPEILASCDPTALKRKIKGNFSTPGTD